MNDFRSSRSVAGILFSQLLVICCFIAFRCGAQANPDRVWSVYKGGESSSNYSPLTEINPSNVSGLRQAWTFTIHDHPVGAAPARSECNPIIVDGVLYASSGNQWAYALDASTGKQLWAFDPLNGESGSEVNRGVTYFERGSDRRIFVSANNFLFALNAKTGKPVPAFGRNGRIDLRIGLRDPKQNIDVSMTTPGIVYKNLLIVGCRTPDAYGSQPGFIRAYDCQSGRLVWTFHTVPYPGEAGYETWPRDAYKVVGGVNNWSGMSVDYARGMVFISLGSPSYDFYGKDRKGSNLYANCIVALDAATGAHRWHFQTVHHDLWDYDLPAPPALITITRKKKKTDAVAQITKQGFVFVLDRKTGNSLFPVRERPFPASALPGEESSPTQPVPVKPRPFARQSITEADLTSYSPADHDSLVKKFRSMRYEGLFTPPDLRGTLELPGTRGGAEWGGAAFDPETNLFYIKSNDAPDLITMDHGTGRSVAKKVRVGNQFEPIDRNARRDQFVNSTAYRTWTDPHGNPAIKPPWGTLSAINMATGDYAWQIPLGNDSMRRSVGDPETGQESEAGPIVTAGGILFIGGTGDHKFRALDKTTGKLLWETTLPAPADATACTYEINGKQYVAISVSGTKTNPSGSIIAFSL